ncbi:Lipid A biosynthesis lauroyl acyltransferase [Parasaccharibacter apium]|uniref:Lipid A biosynthesis lauroyl acyltransferase n=2 Tax=Acetobacteraceae TaxID=433 RepID=A0A7U7J128_9PROT|nr:MULTISPECIES: lauroyl acyltransferase [Acetobacteraceae]MUH02814.1 lauroyl acyltransferase [Bombella sp. ESL0387]MBE1723376.1 lauroyl acyltransferase [Bombella apis]MBR9730155.1 lauroyl acyltransferase [Bombella apis]MCT6813842.1 lauroyl acyltransferase [Bombella apis]MCT6844949.1 lauroyl acyltransferase [Bombella apis]
MKHYLEAWGLKGLLWFASKLPAGLSSRLGGTVAALVGPCLPSSRIADINLHRAFPTMDRKTRRRLVRGCWWNIGSTLGELPHLPDLPEGAATGPGWRVLNDELLHQARKSGRPVIFFSGHLGNWELMPLIVARYDMAFSPFYRAPNNPLVDQLLCRLRRHIVGTPVSFFPKGKQGARDAVRHLARGGYLGVLGDQKMNDGIEVSFFGHPTMTAPAAAALALRFNALIITGHVWREGPARLVLEVGSCLDPKDHASTARSRHDMIRHLTQLLNDELEQWITKRPENWLWLHRRWAKSCYRNKKK